MDGFVGGMLGDVVMVTRGSPDGPGSQRHRPEHRCSLQVALPSDTAARADQICVLWLHLPLSPAEEAALIGSVAWKFRLHPSSPQNMCCKLHSRRLPPKR